MKHYKILTTLLLVLVSICTGCSTIKKEGVDAHFEIITSDYINPDHEKESRPLNISLFYLTDTEAFLQADYFDLFQSDLDPLAGSLIQQSNVLVVPNSRKLYSEEIPENVRAIGVIYQFRQLEKSQWRTVVETPETCFLGFNCESILHGSSIFISVDELNTKIKLVD
ncbi:MAG: type VI secretion system lipoprotein TssJ [Blastopirellula sp.]|nr:MAG: type VI secretion system lipoprotein TssJ [Blastopirellula sp.]